MTEIVMGSDVTSPIIALTHARTHVRVDAENPSLPIIPSLLGMLADSPAMALCDRCSWFGADLLVGVG